MAPRDLLNLVAKLKKSVSSSLTKQIKSEQIRESARALVQVYFKDTRPTIAALEISSDLDATMQTLYALTSKQAATTSYKSTLREIEKLLHEADINLVAEISTSSTKGEHARNQSDTDKLIISTLEELLPATALSYRQVVSDLNETDRFSYRGTATELREIVREVLDHLAPDSDVIKSDGFKFEQDRNRPTMQQKARYILRLRGQAKNAIETPQKALEIVEGTVSALVRSTYDRGSIATHTSSGLSRPAVMQLKMYTDSVLCELLEVHAR